MSPVSPLLRHPGCLYMHMLTTHILTHWHVTVIVVLYSCSQAQQMMRLSVIKVSGHALLRMI